MLTLTEARQALNIHPRTKSALTAWEKAEVISVDFSVRQAAQGIAYALQTGRLTATAEMAVRQMSTYQGLKLLVSVVNNCQVMADVPRFLNKSLTK